MISSRIHVISGPDQGQKYDFTTDLMHIGSNEDNDLTLCDPMIIGRHSSIARKEDRFAIISHDSAKLEIDDVEIPPLEWVWLHDFANIKMSNNTSIQINILSDQSTPVRRNKSNSREEVKREGEPRIDASNKKKETLTSTKKRKRKVARFRNDSLSESSLNFDHSGKLPSLTLNAKNENAEEPVKQSRDNPLILYIALGLSLVFSLILLLADTSSLSTEELSKEQALKTITKFYGDSNKTLLHYQILLRQAQLARSRKDYATEKQNYRTVLTLLNAEDKNALVGLTGNKSNDDELQRILAVLLR